MQSTISKTLDHVLFLAQHLRNLPLHGALIAMLMELRVPLKCSGFEFLRYAVLLQHENPTRGLANDIYLEVSLHYEQNSEHQVEQAIRDAIRSAWRRGSKRAWEWYFSYDGKPVLDKPSNGEFISQMAYILELWQELRKEGGSS